MFTKPMTIRQAIAEDIPFVQAMIWEALLASPTVLADLGVAYLQEAERHRWGSWTEYSDPVFVALDATERKLGAITIKPNDADEPISGWRIGIGVEAEVRGQGVGQHLLERAIAFAREQGASYVDLLVDPVNIRAKALYEHVGFVEVGKDGGAIEMRINLH